MKHVQCLMILILLLSSFALVVDATVDTTIVGVNLKKDALILPTNVKLEIGLSGDTEIEPSFQKGVIVNEQWVAGVAVYVVVNENNVEEKMAAMPGGLDNFELDFTSGWQSLIFVGNGARALVPGERLLGIIFLDSTIIQPSSLEFRWGLVSHNRVIEDGIIVHREYQELTDPSKLFEFTFPEEPTATKTRKRLATTWGNIKK